MVHSILFHWMVWLSMASVGGVSQHRFNYFLWLHGTLPDRSVAGALNGFPCQEYSSDGTGCHMHVIAAIDTIHYQLLIPTFMMLVKFLILSQSEDLN